MSANEDRIVRLRVAGGTGTAAVDASDRVPVTRVVLVEVVRPEPADGEVAELVARLSDPRLICAAHTDGRVSPATAAVVLACDIVVSSASSVWDDAVVQVLDAARRRLPPRRASLLRNGAGLTGDDLYRAGLLTELSEQPSQRAEALAVELTAIPGGSLAGSKEMIDSAAGSDLDAALALESALQVAALQSEEHRHIVETQLTQRRGNPTTPGAQT